MTHLVRTKVAIDAVCDGNHVLAFQVYNHDDDLVFDNNETDKLTRLLFSVGDVVTVLDAPTLAPKSLGSVLGREWTREKNATIGDTSTIISINKKGDVELANSLFYSPVYLCKAVGKPGDPFRPGDFVLYKGDPDQPAGRVLCNKVATVLHVDYLSDDRTTRVLYDNLVYYVRAKDLCYLPPRDAAAVRFLNDAFDWISEAPIDDATVNEIVKTRLAKRMREK